MGQRAFEEYLESQLSGQARQPKKKRSVLEEYVDSQIRPDHEEQPLRTSLLGAATVDPDSFAKKMELGQRAGGLHPDFVDADPANAEELALLNDPMVNSIAKHAPATRRFVSSNPDNAILSKDDLGTLFKIEAALGPVGGKASDVELRETGSRQSVLGISAPEDRAAARTARETLGSLPYGLVVVGPRSAAEGTTETLRIARDLWEIGQAYRREMLVDPNADKNLVARLSGQMDVSSGDGLLDTASEYWGNRVEELRKPWESGSPQWYAQAAGESIGVSLLAAPLGVAGRVPVLVGFSAMAEGGYDEYLEEGYHPLSAAILASTKKSLEGLTEAIGLDALYRGGKPFLKRISGFLLRDLLGEEVNTLANAAIDKMTITPEMTIEDVMAQIVDTAIVTALAGGAQGAVMGAAARMSEEFSRYAEEEAVFQRNREIMESLGESAEGSKLLARMPDKFQEAVAEIKKEGDIHDVGIPFEEWNTYWQEKGEDPYLVAQEVLPDIAAYTEASVGTDIIIPLENYVRHLAGTEDHAGLMPNLRLRPGDMTENENRQYRENRVEDLARLLNYTETEDQAIEDFSRRVFDDIQAKLIAAGRSTTEARQGAALWNARVRSRAKRLGMDPWQLYQERPVEISDASASFLSPGDLQAPTEEIRKSPQWRALAIEAAERKYRGKKYEGGAPLIDRLGSSGQIMVSAEELRGVQAWENGLAPFFTTKRKGKKGPSIRWDVLLGELKGEGYIRQDAETLDDLIEAIQSDQEAKKSGGPRLTPGGITDYEIEKLAAKWGYFQGEAARADEALRRDAASFAEAVEKVRAAGEAPRDQVIMLRQTPLVLKLIGRDILSGKTAGDNGIFVSPHTFRNILDGSHTLTFDMLKQIPEAMADPIAIFDSASERTQGDVVFMLELTDDNGATVVAPVMLRARKKGAEFDVVKSAYAKEKDGVPDNDWFKKQAEKNTRYINRKKIKRWQRRAGVQFPVGSLSNASGNTIRTEADLVKLRQVNPTYYQAVLQSISSADTSIRQVAAALKKISWQSGTTNTDIGGGRFDEGTDYLAEKGVENLVFDPFNRNEQHNRKVVERLKAEQTDTATVTNVLNVIAEPEVRSEVVRQAAKAIKQDGAAYFQIYEGDKKGEGKVTSKGWQNNAGTEFYLDEVRQYFGDVKRKGNLIEARNPQPGETPAMWMLEGINGPIEYFQSAPPEKSAFSRSDEFSDARYFSAVEAGDMGAAQRIVDYRAAQAGYISVNNYRMQHQAPNSHDENVSTNLSNLKESGLVPDDYWTKPQWYQQSSDDYRSFHAIGEALSRQAKYASGEYRIKPGMWMYRAVPKSLKEGKFRNGDWITPLREYAQREEQGIQGGYKVIAQHVELSDIWWDGNSINEFGYDDGKGYAYKNTKNNRKLADVVVRDFDGNIVPPSKRFNPKKEEVYYQQQDSDQPTKPRSGGAFSLGQGEDPRDARGFIRFGPGGEVNIGFLRNANLSTFLHETGHWWLEELRADAARPDAPQQIKDDWTYAQKYLGIEGLAVDAPIPAEAAEKWARSGEAYLMEGEAPSVELQGAFDRFKLWLKDIYREIRNLKVELTDEVRGVFDRLLAADEEIEFAKESAGIGPILFATAEEAGMTQAEFELMRKDAGAAHKEASEKLERKYMNELQRELTRAWKKERVRVRAQVDEESKSNAIFQVAHLLKRGELLDGSSPPSPVKLAPTWMLVDIYGQEFVDSLNLRGMTAKNGSHPDEIAAMFGFEDGRQMLEQMRDAPTRKQWVEAETNRRMKAEHGDMLNDGFATEYAIDAVHNDRTGRVLRAELRAIKRKQREVGPHVRQAEREGKADARATARWYEAEKNIAVTEAAREGREATKEAERQGRKATKEAQREGSADAAATARWYSSERNTERTQNIEQRRAMEASVPPVAAFKEAAQAFVAGLRISALRPDLYLRAEQKAGRAAFRAASMDNWEQAAQEKQKQLLNHYLFVEARKAQQAFQKMQGRWKRSVAAKVDISYRDQINGLLMKSGIVKRQLLMSDGAPSLATFFERQQVGFMDEMGVLSSYSPAEWIISDAPKDITEMTWDEAQELDEAISWLVGNGREEKNAKMLTSDSLINEVRAEALKESEGLKRIVPPKDTSVTYKPAKWKNKYFASIDKLPRLVKWMDGFQNIGSGGKAGVNEQRILWPIMQGLGNKYREQERIDALIKPHMEQLMNSMRKYMDIKKAYMKEKELTHAPLPASMQREGMPWTFERVIALALNMGTQENRDRLESGYGLREGQKEQVTSILTEADWRAIEGIWRAIDTLYPGIADVHSKINHFPLKKVQGMTFTVRTADGKAIEVQGGYYPLRYDGEILRKAGQWTEKDELLNRHNAIYQTPSAKRGFTEARRKNVSMPVKLSLSVLAEHIEDTTTYMHMALPIMDADRITRNSAYMERAEDVMGKEKANEIRPALKDILRRDGRRLDGVEKAIMWGRQATSMYYIGWNMWTVAQNVMNIFPAINAVGVKVLSDGMADFYLHPIEAYDEICAKSARMAQRRDAIDRELAKGMRDFKPKMNIKGVTLDDVRESGYALMKMTDTMFAGPLWKGAYNEGLRLYNGDETAAISHADDKVTSVFGSGLTVDLSRAQRNPGLVSLFTTFSSFMMTQQQVMANQYQAMKAGKMTKREFAYRFAMTMLWPAVAQALLFSFLTAGEPPEGEEVLSEVVTYGFGGLPLVRDIVPAIDKRSRNFQAGIRLPSLDIFKDIEILFGNLIDFDAEKAAWSLAKVASFIFRVPASRIYERWQKGSEQDLPQNVLIPARN